MTKQELKTLSKIKKLAKEELVYEAVLYHQLGAYLYDYELAEADYLKIITAGMKLFTNEEYTTIIGISFCIADYLVKLYNEMGKTIKDFTYEGLLAQYRTGSNRWY